MSDAFFFRSLAGIPPATASTADSVLVVIDVQNEYAQGLLKVRDFEASSKVIEGLVKKYRAAGGHIVHVLHEVPEGTPVFTPNTPLAAEYAPIAPPPAAASTEVTISKKHPGSFADTTLGDIVAASGKNKVVLVGYMAHVCVSTTARQASQRGLETVVVADAIGDRDLPGISGQELTKTVISELRDFFATILNSADIQ